MTSHDTQRNLRHDLRTPINHILGFGDMLREVAEENGQAEYVAAFQEIERLARAMLQHINSNRDPSSPDGAPNLETLRADLAPLLAAIAARCDGLRAQFSTAEVADLGADLEKISVAVVNLGRLAAG